MKARLACLSVLVLAGCAGLENPFEREAAPETETPAAAAAPAASPPPPAGARTAEQFDTTTAEQRAAAAAPEPAGARSLGTTVASLGSPTEPGFWLKTPLVDAETEGRVTNPATGKSASVTLIPIDGPSTAGSRMSLPAMRLIGADLTDLTTVEVSAGG
ncbi:hypothetical protein R5H30_02925 [Sulfitobacter sp. D35]|uniref:hypothetical protein n=1 Tax=Sulfitobacter sp. D35 TaxID=3083252 RepID=UPI00296F6BF9|nr:hypothetical protein [Sulfitobacter sp. D35]MDW4496921.1 hypothetical protein [Sulfitobacter sp. D35]